MRIRVHPEHLREVAALLARESAEVERIGEELQRAVHSLDTWAWDGHSRMRAEPMLSRVGPESRCAAERLDELSHSLRRIADAFAHADETHRFPSMEYSSSFQPGSDFSLDTLYLQSVSDVFKRIDNLKDIGEVIAAVVVALGIVRGMTYPGQLIFHGSHSLKKLAGISPYLTHIKSANLPKHILKQHLKPDAASIAWDFVVEITGEFAENWQEYHGDIGKVFVATVVESVLGVGCAFLFSAAFVALGGVLLPGPGAIIGAKVGRIVGSWVGGKVAEMKNNGRKVDDSLSDFVINKLFQAN